jgi:apolipoprotein N-acyltransferase
MSIHANPFKPTVFSLLSLLWCVFFGFIAPFSFAPFEVTVMSYISLGGLYFCFFYQSRSRFFLKGFCYGLGFFSMGVSWIYVSIHAYGHLSPLLALLCTCLFIVFLSSYIGLLGFALKIVTSPSSHWMTQVLTFSALFTLLEFVRGTLFTGFPWLLIGYSGLSSPIKSLMPIMGIYGATFVITIMAALLVESFFNIKKALLIQIPIICTFLFLNDFEAFSWTEKINQPLSTGIIQENLSMKDKWDEELFYTLLNNYQKDLKKTNTMDLTLLPESAIPLPYQFISEYVNQLNDDAKHDKHGLVIGIPESTDDNTHYYNTALGLGEANGTYQKQHLVPFGEYIPKQFQYLTQQFQIDDPGMTPGTFLSLLTFKQFKYATLLCYEIAYSDILRQQIPDSQWIISLSEDGWFGHSLAIYQHVQMAQARALQTGRYHLVANNAGLSSIIDEKGNIIKQLPPFEKGILKGTLYPFKGLTPWVIWGDLPIIVLCCFILLFFLLNQYSILAHLKKRRYPNQPNS